MGCADGGRCPAGACPRRRRVLALFPTLPHPGRPWPLASWPPCCSEHTPWRRASLEGGRGGPPTQARRQGSVLASWNLPPSGSCWKVRAPLPHTRVGSPTRPAGHLQIQTCKSSPSLLRCPRSPVLLFNQAFQLPLAFPFLDSFYLVLSDAPPPLLFSSLLGAPPPGRPSPLSGSCRPHFLWPWSCPSPLVASPSAPHVRSGIWARP